MGAPPYVPPTRPISTAMFWSNSYTFDPLYAGEVISQSANIAGGLNTAGTPLLRGTVLYGPAASAPITNSTLLTTATGAGQARCILAADIDTSGGQVTGLVYTQGKFLDTAMTFTTAGAASDCASLWDYGIYVLTVEGRSGQLIPMMKLPTTGGPIPNALSPKETAKANKEEVEAIKNAMAAFRGQPVPIAGMGGAKDPPWYTAQFGEREPTKEEQARAKAAEQTYDLDEKQEKAREEMMAKHAKESAELLKKQQEEREHLAKQEEEAMQHARQANSTKEPPVLAPPPPKKDK